MLRNCCAPSKKCALIGNFSGDQMAPLTSIFANLLSLSWLVRSVELCRRIAWRIIIFYDCQRLLCSALLTNRVGRRWEREQRRRRAVWLCWRRPDPYPCHHSRRLWRIPLAVAPTQLRTGAGPGVDREGLSRWCSRSRCLLRYACFRTVYQDLGFGIFTIFLLRSRTQLST